MTTNPPPYMPAQGSLAERVTAFFLRNPDDELSRGDVALKFEVQVNDVARLLKPLLDDNTLVLSRPEGRGVVRNYSAGLALREAAKKQGSLDLDKPACTAATGPESRSRKTRGKQKIFLDAVDLDALKTGSGDPVSARTKFGYIASKWQVVLDKVPNVGDWVEVPAEWHEALSAQVRKNNTKHKQNGLPDRHLVRKVSAVATRLWRTA